MWRGWGCVFFNLHLEIVSQFCTKRSRWARTLAPPIFSNYPSHSWFPSIRFDLFKRYKVNFFNVYLPWVLKTGLPKIFRQVHHIAGNLSNPGIDRNQWKFQKTCMRGAYFLRAASVELSVLLLHRHRAIIWYAFGVACLNSRRVGLL